MKTSSAKAKGRRFQQWVAKEIANLIGCEYGKDEPIRSREMGQSGTDVVFVGEAKEKFKYDIECKNSEKWSVPQWIEQARNNNVAGRDWLLLITKNRFKPIVVMDWDAFIELFKKGMNNE